MLVEDPTNEASDTPIVKSIDLEGKGSDIKEFEYPPESEKSKGLRYGRNSFILLLPLNNLNEVVYLSVLFIQALFL